MHACRSTLEDPTWLGYGAAVGAVAATWWLARAWLPVSLAWVPPLLVATSTTLIGQAGSGLETTMCTLLVTLGLWRWARECGGEARAPGLGIALLAAAALVRIDCSAVLVGAFVLKTWWCGPIDRGVRTRDTIVLALGIAIPTAFRIAYYGDWVPNPVRAKFGFDGGPLVWKSGINYVLEWLRVDVGAPLLALGLGCAAWCRAAGATDGSTGAATVPLVTRRSERTTSALVVLCVGWLAYVVASGGDHMPYQRFVAPMWPALAVATIVGLHRACSPQLAARRSGRLIAFAAMLALAVEPVAQSLSRGNVPASGAAGEHYRRAIGEFFAAEAKARGRTLVVAGGAAGYMGHFGGPQVRFVDILGLCDAAIARHGRRDARMPPGHQQGDGLYVLSQRPDYVVFGSSTPGDLWQRSGADDLLHRVLAAGATRWASDNGHLWAVSERELLEAPQFARCYELVTVTLPTGQPFRVCRRRRDA